VPRPSAGQALAPTAGDMALRLGNWEPMSDIWWPQDQRVDLSRKFWMRGNKRDDMAAIVFHTRDGHTIRWTGYGYPGWGGPMHVEGAGILVRPDMTEDELAKYPAVRDRVLRDTAISSCQQDADTWLARFLPDTDPSIDKLLPRISRGRLAVEPKRRGTPELLDFSSTGARSIELEDLDDVDDGDIDVVEAIERPPKRAAKRKTTLLDDIRNVYIRAGRPLSVHEISTLLDRHVADEMIVRTIRNAKAVFSRSMFGCFELRKTAK